MDENLLLAEIAMMVGFLVGASVVARAALARFRVPSIIGYLAVGFALRLLDDQWGFMSGDQQQVLRFLGELGAIALLFRVGIEANQNGLIRQFGKAWPIWIGNVVVSGGLGFGRSEMGSRDRSDSQPRGCDGLDGDERRIPSVVWKSSGRLESRGQLFLDIAELDEFPALR